jgi:hypothetical protein
MRPPVEIGRIGMAKTTVYAARDIKTKIRVTYRYRTREEVLDMLALLKRAMGDVSNLEVYRTTQDLPRKYR